MSEERAPSSLAPYSDLFGRLLDCTFLLDPETHVILEANPAVERVIGIVPETLPGTQLSKYVADDAGREELEKALRIAMRRYHPRQFDSRWKHPDGRALTMELVACPLKLANGKEILQVIAHDATARREAEQKLQVLLRQLQDANAKLEVLSTHDEMTGLANFRHFKSQLAQEHVRSSRFATPYSIVFCDIDFFKKYNDANGHPAGDRLLRQFAGILQKAFRTTDLPARYGGEEFVVLCPGVETPAAHALAERIRKTVEETAFEFSHAQPGGKLTISVGVASFPDDAKDPDLVVKAADEAVYSSKHNGRNKVTTSGEMKAAAKKAA
jgi:diguanylate cyclase (GGDEF)-like protein/PAS domain S-box-containing protein